jgi:hypothetical protein
LCLRGKRKGYFWGIISAMTLKDKATKYKPGVPKRHLLLVAAFVWLFAGGFLAFRGIRSMPPGDWAWWETAIAIVGGLLFFWVLFLRISTKHIRRITSLEILRPCVFSFFNLRSYLMMALMITMGVTVRKLHLVSGEAISYFFITMAVPLLISSARFFGAWSQYDLITEDERRKTN